MRALLPAPAAAFDPDAHRTMKLRLGEEIIQMRLSLGIGQEGAARILGRTKSAIHRWEAAKTTPDLDELAYLSAALGHRFVCRILTEPEARRLDRMEAAAEIGPEPERDARLALIERVAERLLELPLAEADAFVRGIEAAQNPRAAR